MASPSSAQLGDAIRQAAARANVTQKQIAEAVGKDQTTISAWMKGENWPQLSAIPAIEELCGLRPGQILREAGFVEPATDARDAIMADIRLSIETRESIVVIYDDLLASETQS